MRPTYEELYEELAACQAALNAAGFKIETLKAHNTELAAQRDQLRTALGNLVARIYAESMIPAGTLGAKQ